MHVVRAILNWDEKAGHTVGMAGLHYLGKKSMRYSNDEVRYRLLGSRRIIEINVTVLVRGK